MKYSPCSDSKMVCNVSVAWKPVELCSEEVFEAVTILGDKPLLWLFQTLSMRSNIILALRCLKTFRSVVGVVAGVFVGVVVVVGGGGVVGAFGVVDIVGISGVDVNR